ncbi:MAG TPA: CRISPR-associated endonuclease Cas1 [Verrucomicrobiae bacterium]|nr:CRISPR-associated endonuclease Cas1 [Verrucomicrobiae bacterium]
MASPVEVSVADLAWHTVPLRLRNVRNVFAREHPLWVLHGLLMFVVPRRVDRSPAPWWFRWLGERPAERVQKGRIYELELILPTGDLATAEATVTALQKHLKVERAIDPGRNFEVATAGPPRRRTLADLQSEGPAWPASTDEVCLEFTTPLQYTPADKQRPWLLDGPGFGRLLLARLEKLFDVRLKASADATIAWAGVKTLPQFWEYAAYPHEPKSKEGTQLLHGNAGPFYLRGQLETLRPWLLLGEELGAGRKLHAGAGRFSLVFDRPCFDPLLARPDSYAEALADLRLRSDLTEEFNEELGDPAVAAGELAEIVGKGQWQPETAKGFRVAKTSGTGDRLITMFPARDRLVQQTLQWLLAPAMDRLFEPQSHGYRLGHSVETARALVQSAWRDGYAIVLESDIEAFFDSVDWPTLEQLLDAVLPRADRHTRAALHALVRTPVRLDRRAVFRERGLLQGSPLSPLLANLYLDPFDEEMTRRGFQLVRYADDFLVLCRDEAEAQRALAAAQEVLGQLNLTLKSAKTAVTPFAAGFSFLGLRFGGGFDTALVEESALEKTVFLRHPHAWVGVDHDAVVVREGGRLLARMPFRRVRELMLLGAGGVSARLVERCATRGIPISFCTAGGRLQNTLWRHDQSHYLLAAAHAAKHAALPDAHRLAAARALVSGKLVNHLAWLRATDDAELRAAREEVSAAIRLLPEAGTIESLRGVEGMAARAVFRALNDRVTRTLAGQGRTAEAAFFHSDRRSPGEGYDPWNSLLDFLYSMLFHRINSLLRLRGLNPFLGVLHSHQASYESLVCDLQEPFRVRCDRLLQSLVNRREVTPEDFIASPPVGGVILKPELSGPAIARIIEAFARELDTQLAGEAGNWGRLIEAQVLCVQRWVERDDPFRVYHAELATGAMVIPAA